MLGWPDREATLLHSVIWEFESLAEHQNKVEEDVGLIKSTKRICAIYVEEQTGKQVLVVKATTTERAWAAFNDVWKP